MRGFARTSGWIPVLILAAFAAGPVSSAVAADTDGDFLLRLRAGYDFDPVRGAPALDAGMRAAPLAEGADGTFLVQFAGPVLPEWRAALEGTGARIHGYVPDNAFLIRASAEALERIRGMEPVRWAGRWEPAFKTDPAVGTMEFRHPERKEDPLLTLHVRVADDLDAVADRIDRMEGAAVLDRAESPYQKIVAVHADPAVLSDIARMEEVLWIEERPEFFLHNNTTKWVVQSNSSGQTPVWDRGIHGEDEIVYVMDSGLDYNSCWFRDTGSAPPGASHRKVISYQNYGGGVAYDACDPGHGTHVCGTLAGDQSFINPGVYSYNGMAYKAKLGLQDIQDDDSWSCMSGAVQAPTSLTQAYVDAYAGGGRIHSNSWGSTSNAYDSYAVDVDGFMADNRDFLVVFAAGNSGSGAATVGSPGTAKNCVTVGATRQAPNQETIASYSSRGPTSDDRYKPTVTAPGGEAGYAYITSVDNNTGNPPSATCAVQSDPFQGTSMATPAVAGLCALVRQYYREGWYPDGAEGSGAAMTPSAALIKATLVSAGTDMGAANIPNNDEGWGRVLLDDALYFDGDSRELRVVDDGAGLATGGHAEHEYEVETGEALEVVLVWTDEQASQGAATALVNDLDLTVTGPSGTFKGNVFSGGASAAGGSYDRLNVEEVVRIAAPAAGTYTVRVDGYNVPSGPQPFALVMNGAFAEAGGVDPDLSTVEANDHVMLAPDGNGDSTLTVVVTARDGSGDPIADIPAGDVALHLSAVSGNGQSMHFCASGGSALDLLSSVPTDGSGRVTFAVTEAGGCGTVDATATIQGVGLTAGDTANMRSPDFTGDGMVNYFDTFQYLPLLQAGTGYCGNLNGDANDDVNYFDTFKYLSFLAGNATCP